jgi:hypothetical protein
MTKQNDLENKLRMARFDHLTISELEFYADRKLDRASRVRAEAHINECFICKRRLANLEEHNAALNNQKVTAKDKALVKSVVKQSQSDAPDTARTGKRLSSRERLAEYLRQFIAVWQATFIKHAVRGSLKPGKEVLRSESEDGIFEARAVLEKNASLTIHISSSDLDLHDVKLKVSLGPTIRRVTLERISESEVYAKIEVSKRERPRNLTDISIEII